MRVPWIAVGLAVLSSAIWMGGDVVASGLSLSRDGIVGRCEIWRLVSGHFVHGNFEHFAWNVGAFVVIVAIYEWLERPSVHRFAAEFVFSAAMIGIVLLALLPSMGVYRGLSGVANVFFVLTLTSVWRETASPLVLVAGGAAVVKFVYEILTHSTVFAVPSGHVLPEAHAVGFMLGMMMSWAYIITRRRHSNLERKAHHA